MARTSSSSSALLILLGVMACVAGGGLGAFAVLKWRSGPVVREYLVTHPEVLPEAMENLRKTEDAKAMAGVRGPAETPFPGSVLGNPQGRTVLVEFTDFACTYCRRSVEDVDALVARHPDLKVVVRQLPILSPESADAARMGLAAAEQGKYPAFHRAMFALGHPAADTIAEAARMAGLDMARAKKALANPRLQAEIDGNLELARRLGIAGTPAWIAGGRMTAGAIGADRLEAALWGNAS